MQTIQSLANEIAMVVGAPNARNRRPHNPLQNVDNALAFMKIANKAMINGWLRAVLISAHVSYATYWRLKHGCLPGGMNLTIWPALRDALAEAKIAMWPIRHPEFHEVAPNGSIVKITCQTISNREIQKPHTSAFYCTITDRCSQANKPEIEGKTANDLTLKMPGYRRAKVGTPAFAKLVQRILDGEFKA